MYYKEILPITREEAETSFSSGTSAEICDALVRLVYYDPDWRWVQEKCLHFGKHPQSEIRGLSATCIGHLVRIHGVLDMQSVQPLLDELLKDPKTSERAQDALDDIEVYLNP